jgi:FAD dependent oxidoreductase TIGR03364
MVPTTRFDIAIVGAGILGLAHAYHFARAGLSVGVFERGIKASGASVRNFGMVWPIGQPPGEMREMALRSQKHWIDVLEASGIWHNHCGSLHLAYHEDELAVLSEFAEKGKSLDYDCSLITAGEAIETSPVIRSENLLGAMWSPSEVCVFPRQVVSELPAYLETLGVKFHFGRAVSHVESGRLTFGAEEVVADHIFLCTGDEFETLFPEEYAKLGMTRSKLQMMRAKPHRTDYRIGTHLCAGLTLGHYANFRICEQLPKLLERYGITWPDQVKWGIHLLVSQHEDGQLTIGDSHEYGLEVTPFLRQEIDRLILDYLDTFLDTSEFEITERWYGVYAKHPTRTKVVEKLADRVYGVTGVGGAGMTLSFGLAEQSVSLVE